MFIASFPLSAATNSSWFARAWQAEDGLPEHTIVGLAQAPDGYLWVATHRSLSRFDGIRFQEFTPPTSDESPTEQIRAMLVDRRGRLWLARDFGTVARFEGGSVTHVFEWKDVAPGAQARVMVEDGAGGIWIGDSSGSVLRIHDDTFQCFGTSDGLPGGGTCWLATDTRGQLWFSQSGRAGIFRDGRFKPLVTIGNSSGRMAAARDGGVWMSSGLRLFRFREGGALEAVADLNTEIGGGDAVVTALYEDKAHGLWIGTSSGGLFRWDSGAVAPIDLSHPNITNIAEDSEGNFWVGTRGGGLNRLSPRVVELIGPQAGLPFAATQSACEDAGGVLWVVGQNGGLARRTNGSWELVSTNSRWAGGGAACVAADTEGDVLIGTREQGLFRHQTNAFVPLDLNRQLPNLHVHAFYLCSNEDLWIAVDSAVVRQRARDGKVTQFTLPAGISDIRTMAEDAAGAMWLGTTSRGLLLRVQDETLSNVTATVVGEPRSIRCLQVTSDGSLWIGFADQGLGRWKNGRFAQLRAAEGLWHEYISQILPDDFGRLWFACNRGIFQVAQAELNAVADGTATQMRSIAFGRGDGVPNLQAAFGICPAASRTRDGRLLIPMLTGVAIVQPALLRKNQAPPPVIIERLVANGHAIVVHDSFGSTVPSNSPPPALRLGPGIARLEIEFTALSLSSPENVTFRYQLEGLDQDWIEAGTARIARYSRMPPGEYRFRVTACNQDGVWNPNGASLEFVVAAPFYRTWWFQIPAALALLGAVAGLVRYVELRKMRRQVERAEREGAIERERARIAKDIHDDLGASLTEITLLSELAQSSDAPPAEVQSDMRKIAARTRQLTRSLDATVWAVNPRNDTLDSLVSYLCHHAEEYLNAAGIRCRLDVPEASPARLVTAAVRHNVYLIVKEALHNVVKHSGATEVLLRIAINDEKLMVAVTDNGRGFNASADAATPRAPGRRGNGLENMRRRADEIGGQLELQSEAGHGTRVQLTVRFAEG